MLLHEQDYTGLGAVDPNNLDQVYISTPVHPGTGEATDHYEIYRGQTADGGASWSWSAVTEDSHSDNLRPLVVPGDPSVHAVLWFRGSMASSQAYTAEVVGQVGSPEESWRTATRPSR
jgi:hypothetical protein